MTDVPIGPTPAAPPVLPALPALPCGRDPEGLVVQVADGAALDAHQLACPYCRAALTELEGLWAPVRAVAGHRPAAPRGALDEAFRRLRAMAGGHAEYARFEGRDGRTSVGGGVVVALARHLAAGVPGVRAALCRLEDAGSTAAGAVLEITLAATYGVDLAALGERIRRTVVRGVREHTGLEPAAVHVVVDDVLEAAHPGAGVDPW